MMSEPTVNMADLNIDYSMEKIFHDYPRSIFPEKLNKRTGKAKSCLYEAVDLNLYDKEARMVTFHTELNKIHAWIKTFDIFYYDNLGKSNDYNVKWRDDPPVWSDPHSNANSIIIELYDNKENLFYNVTFFVTTGTIRVQGTCYEKFALAHFPVMKEILASVLDIASEHSNMLIKGEPAPDLLNGDNFHLSPKGQQHRLVYSMNSFLFLLFLPMMVAVCDSEEKTESEEQFHWDPRGYVIFCLCMGRFGNQAEHFLGGLSFAKHIDRTLILPPFRTYKNIEFSEWFQLAPLREYHRVILAEDFMKHLAPKYWPPENRTAFCYGKPGTKCKMKEGNPFGPFWDGLGVNFVEDIPYTLHYADYETWPKIFPADRYPVIAMRGAPAPFPMVEANVALQKYLIWSDKIEEEVQAHMHKLFKGEKYIGIHLRNGIDWKSACEHADGQTSYMASPQCLGYKRSKKVTTKMCYPPKEEILRILKNTVVQTKIKHIYVATDKNPMTTDIEEYLKAQKVKVHHLDPWLPQIDLAILGKSDYFVGNCVSSFTSFVSRERLVKNKPTSYWGL